MYLISRGQCYSSSFYTKLCMKVISWVSAHASQNHDLCLSLPVTCFVQHSSLLLLEVKKYTTSYGTSIIIIIITCCSEDSDTEEEDSKSPSMLDAGTVEGRPSCCKRWVLLMYLSLLVPTNNTCNWLGSRNTPQWVRM